jgi:hypothetical protein
VEYNGKRFLKIRDPWAQSEWTGRWSDGSKEWTTAEWQGAPKALDHKFGNDGEFIMEYEDFLNVWTTIECTQIFDTSWIQSSHWLNTMSRHYPCAWQYGDVSCTYLSLTLVNLALPARIDRYFHITESVAGHTRSLASRHTILVGFVRTL